MKIKFVFIICTFFLSISAQCQVTNLKNQVFVQLAGHGLLISLNYERKIIKTLPLYCNAGVGVYGNEKLVTVPLGLKYLIQPKKEKQNYLSLGLGGTYTKANVYLYATMPKYANGIEPKNTMWNILPSIGYRGINKKKIVYSIDFLLLYNAYRKSMPYIGFSVGKAF
jgi:hypothetical protein